MYIYLFYNDLTIIVDQYLLIYIGNISVNWLAPKILNMLIIIDYSNEITITYLLYIIFLKGGILEIEVRQFAPLV